MKKPIPKPPKAIATDTSLSTRQILLRLALIGGLSAAVFGTFAFAGDFIGPKRLSAATIVNSLQAAGGNHPGFRRNHAKGVCVAGYFEGNGNGLEVSDAAVFRTSRTPVIGRFAIPGGNPNVADASVPVRSLALDFQLQNGEEWRTAMNNTGVFVVNTPQGFYDQQIASKPDPATGKPDPKKIAQFFASHPETKPFTNWVKTHKPSSGFANGSYNSLTAFEATNAAGEHRIIRWSMVPEIPYQPVTPDETVKHDFLIPDVVEQLGHGPLRWHLVVTVAAPGDKTDDATLAWPENREKIDAGTLVLTSASPQIDGDCRDINFDPTILPSGLKPSSDPLLAARSAAYAVSFNRRISEEARTGSSSSLRMGEKQ